MSRALAVLTLLSVALAAGPAPAGPVPLTYGAIPFGKSEAEVLQEFKGAKVTENPAPYIEAVGAYSLAHYFEGGLQESTDRGTCFLPDVVRKYTITDGAWDGIEQIMLYFQGFEGRDKPRRLFMLKQTRVTPPAGADFTRMFEELAAPITKAAGHGPVIHQGRLQSFDEQAHGFYLPALIGVWDQGETLVFLMVANSQEGPKPPEVIYVSKDDLEEYLENCKVMSD